MRRLLQVICAVVITGVILLPTAASAQPTDEHVLIIGVSRGRSSDSRLLKGLGEHLQRSGLLLTGESLTAADRTCEAPDCIENLARREGAQLVLTAKLQDNPPSTVFITMALFDAVRRAPFQATALCDPCSSESLLGKLSDVADKLVRQSREARESPAAAPLTPSVPIVPAVAAPGVDLDAGGPLAITGGGQTAKGAERGFNARLSLPRKLIAGALGTAALGLLIQSAVWVMSDGSPCARDQPAMALLVDGRPSYCVFDNKKAYGAGFAVTGGLLIGVGLTLFLPESTKKQQKE